MKKRKANTAMTISYRTDTINDTAVLSYFPPSHKGVVYFFHGKGGNAAKFSGKAAGLADKAVGLGLAAVFFSCKGTKWTEADNLPIVEAARTLLRARGKLTPRMPEYVLGHSSGGGFAPYVADKFGMNAVALYSSAGHEQLFRTDYDSPTIFLPGEMDTMVTPAEAKANFDLLNGRGVRAAFEVRTGEGHEFSLVKSGEVFKFFEAALK